MEPKSIASSSLEHNKQRTELSMSLSTPLRNTKDPRIECKRIFLSEEHIKTEC